MSLISFPALHRPPFQCLSSGSHKPNILKSCRKYSFYTIITGSDLKISLYGRLAGYNCNRSRSGEAVLNQIRKPSEYPPLEENDFWMFPLLAFSQTQTLTFH
jgi:hypothetical protein